VSPSNIIHYNNCYHEIPELTHFAFFLNKIPFRLVIIRSHLRLFFSFTFIVDFVDDLLHIWVSQFLEPGFDSKLIDVTPELHPHLLTVSIFLFSSHISIVYFVCLIFFVKELNKIYLLKEWLFLGRRLLLIFFLTTQHLVVFRKFFITELIFVEGLQCLSFQVSSNFFFYPH